MADEATHGTIKELTGKPNAHKEASHLSAAIAKGRRVIRHPECPSRRRRSTCNPAWLHSKRGSVKGRRLPERSHSALTFGAYCIGRSLGCSRLWVNQMDPRKVQPEVELTGGRVDSPVVAGMGKVDVGTEVLENIGRP